MKDHAVNRHYPQSKGPAWQRVLGTILALVLISCAPFSVWADSIDHVVFVSIDGLRGDLLQNLINGNPLAYPNFKRLVEEGASTFNARSDYDYTETLQNHTTLATGRGVTGPAGHNWTGNSDPSSSQTLHTNKGSYVSSVWDVAHDSGLSTSLYAGKSKLVLFKQSYDAAHSNNGQNKIDRYLNTSSTSSLIADFTSNLNSQQFGYSFVHILDTDSVGHSSGWESAAWNNAVKNEDGYLGSMLAVIEGNPALDGHTAIIVTADHGGTGTGHGTASDWRNYTIPFLVWGPGVAAGADLYALNSLSRLDPGFGRPTYSASLQPIRGGDGSNLALQLLGLGPIPGSTINNLQTLAVAVLSISLTWNENGPGNWDQQRWIGDTPPYFPDDKTHVEVKTDTVTVAADGSALTLTIASGGVAIGPGAVLTVGQGVDVAAGAALDVAGTLGAKSLTVAGTSTIAGGAGISIGEGVEVAAGATLDLAGTLDAQWLTTAGMNIIADGAVLSVSGSLTLDSGIDLTGATLTTIPQVTDVHVNQNGVLTLGRALAGRELHVAGRVQTAGAQVTALNVTGGGLLMSSADVIAQDVNVSGGVIHLTDGANLSVAAMQVTGGTVNTGTGHVVVGQRLKIGDHTTIDVANATFQVSSSNLADPLAPDNFTLSGGRLTISGGVVVPRGAIAFWRLAEGEGLIAADFSTAGNDHFGTINGASWVSDDPEHGTVLSFDGEDDYLEAANTGDIQLGNAFTIAMWINTSQKGVELVGKGDGDHVWESREKALYIDQANGQVTFTGMYSGMLSGTTNVADGHWHHVAVTFNTLNDQEVYLDGAKDTAVRAYSGRADSGDVLRLGWAETTSSGGYREYVGLMDDVYLYDRSLTTAEVADLYQAFGSRVEALPNVNLRVTADSTLYLEAADDDVTLGHLALEPGVNLKVTGATVSFQDLTAGHLSSVEGDFSVTGTLSPGDSPGRLNVVGSLEMHGDSIYQWELGVSAADLVALEGDLKLADGWTLRLGDAGGTCGASAQFDLFTYTGSLTLGTYRLDPQQVEASGRWNWSDATILHDGSRVYLTGLTVVPEPGTMALAALAVLGVLAHARRRRCPV